MSDRQLLKALEWSESVENGIPECANDAEARHGERARQRHCRVSTSAVFWDVTSECTREVKTLSPILILSLKRLLALICVWIFFFFLR